MESVSHHLCRPSPSLWTLLVLLLTWMDIDIPGGLVGFNTLQYLSSILLHLPLLSAAHTIGTLMLDILQHSTIWPKNT